MRPTRETNPDADEATNVNVVNIITSGKTRKRKGRGHNSKKSHESTPKRSHKNPTEKIDWPDLDYYLVSTIGPSCVAQCKGNRNPRRRCSHERGCGKYYCRVCHDKSVEWAKENRMEDRVRVDAYDHDDPSAPGTYLCPECLGFCKCAKCTRGCDSASTSPVPERSPQIAMPSAVADDTQDDEETEDAVEVAFTDDRILDFDATDDCQGGVLGISSLPADEAPSNPALTPDSPEVLEWNEFWEADEASKETTPSVVDEEETHTPMEDETTPSVEQEETSVAMEEEEEDTVTLPEETPPSTTPSFVSRDVPYAPGSTGLLTDHRRRLLVQLATQRDTPIWIPRKILGCSTNMANELVYGIEWTSVTGAPSGGKTTMDTDSSVTDVFDGHRRLDPLNLPGANEMEQLFWEPVKSDYFVDRYGTAASSDQEAFPDTPTGNAEAREAVKALSFRRNRDAENYKCGGLHVMMGLNSIMDTLSAHTEAIDKTNAIMATLTEQNHQPLGGKSPRTHRTGKTLLSLSALREQQQASESEHEEESEEDGKVQEDSESEYEDGED